MLNTEKYRGKKPTGEAGREAGKRILLCARNAKAGEGTGTSEAQGDHLTKSGWEGDTVTAARRRKCLSLVPKGEWGSARQRRRARLCGGRKQLPQG